MVDPILSKNEFVQPYVTVDIHMYISSVPLIDDRLSYARLLYRIFY